MEGNDSQAPWDDHPEQNDCYGGHPSDLTVVSSRGTIAVWGSTAVSQFVFLFSPANEGDSYI